MDSASLWHRELKTKLRVGLVINREFHESNKWVSATTYYLVEALKERFDCVYIQNQLDYELNLNGLEAIISMEPGWAAEKIDFVRTEEFAAKLVKIPSYILYSDPHANKWRQDYFLRNRLEYVLSYYDAPMRYHFDKIPTEKLIHFPWAIPDGWVGDGQIACQGQREICCFGGSKSRAYELRNWCRGFGFVESASNSGCENKVMSDAEYIEWLSGKDASIAAGSDEVCYKLTMPKYFEIAAAGSLLFAQKTDDLGRLGFEHNKNCIIFERDNFEKLAKAYLAEPEKYIPVRQAGRELIRQRHCLSVRMDFLEDHIRGAIEVKQSQVLACSSAVEVDNTDKRKRILFIVDSAGWAHDFKTDGIIKSLGDSYDMRKTYKADVTADDIDAADLVVVYYWREFNEPNMKRLLDVFEKNRHKILLGICSHGEMEGEDRSKGMAVLKSLAAGVFVNSLILYREFSQLFDVPVFYTPNGVDTEFFRPAEGKTHGEKLRVGWAGSLTNNSTIRGYHDYIEPAVNSLEGVELVTCAREDKWRDRQGMLDFYRNIDVYICASLSEGTPNPCLEAAACGVPVVTTRVGNMPELISDGVNGLFVERDVRDIAGEIGILRDSVFLRKQMSLAIKKSIGQWSWEIQAEKYRRMFDVILANQGTEASELFKSSRQVYLASADRMSSVLGNVGALKGLACKKVDTYATVIGGLSGLNYLLELEAEKVVFFDLNPAAVRYARFIVEMISVSADHRDFISRIFSRSVDGFCGENNTGELTVDNQVQYLRMACDKGLLADTLSKLSAEGRGLYAEFLAPYLAGRTVDGVRNCRRLLPCWSVDECVPVGGGKDMGYDENKQLVPNTNSFFYGNGWLGSAESFNRVKGLLSSARVEFLQFDLLAGDLRCLCDFSENNVVHASNIDDWFAESWQESVQRWVGKTVDVQGQISIITTNGGVQQPGLDPHDYAYSGIRDYVFGEVVEVTHKVPWGFWEFEARTNVVFDDYLANDYEADTAILHILAGETHDRGIFESSYKKALSVSKRILVLEHNADSTDFSKADTEGFYGFDELGEVLGELNATACAKVTVAKTFMGEKEHGRNMLFVVDVLGKSEQVRALDDDNVFDYFVRAREAFEHEDFETAAALMNKYRTGVDYSKLKRKSFSRQGAETFDVSVIVVTYNRGADLVQCLESLSVQDCGGFEVVVVDNGSSGVEKYHHLIDQYIQCPVNVLLSEGRNIGACGARGRIVAFLDDDALAPEDFVSSIKRAFETHDIYGLRGTAKAKTEGANSFAPGYYKGGKAFATFCDLEGCSAFRRDIYLENNGMDPLLFGHEGSDLTYRIIKKYDVLNKVIYWPGTYIRHDVAVGADDDKKKQRYTRIEKYLKLKHGCKIFTIRDIVEHTILAGQEPKFSFVMIVLNGMPFIEYSLKSVYDFAHEIIIVEGAVESCGFAANDDGSSKDGTVEFIKSFDDPAGKIRLIQGKWPEKCEMQNEALKHVTGDYVWLIDSDEVYKACDLRKVSDLLKRDGSVSQVNFIPDNFFKGLDYTIYSDKFSDPRHHYRRLFKFLPGSVFTNHRPPTMVWPNCNFSTEQFYLVDGNQTRKMDVILYHYSYVLPEQVYQKIELYNRYGWGKNWDIDLCEWYEECFSKWTPESRRIIDAKYPIWTGDKNSRTEKFCGTHPAVMADFAEKYLGGSVQKSAIEEVGEVSEEAGEVRSVLIVRSDSIGDFIIFSGAIEYYKKLYPGARISLVVSDAVAQVAGCCPLIDEVISFNREKIVYDRESALGFIEAIRDRKFDVAICPAYSRDKVSDFIAGNSGAGRRIAASGDEANQSRERIKENNKLFTQIVPMSDGIRLETERNTEFIAALGAEVSGVYKPKVWVSDEDRGIAEKLISDMRVLRFVVVAPFAQSDLRKWQQEKWAELISGYADYEIVIVGTGADFDDAEQIKALSAHRFVHNICGQTNIGQLAWIIKGCEFCISLESASAHLAAAVDRCCAVIVGGGHFGRFMPYSEKTEMVFNKMDCFGCDWKCVFGDGRCVKSITVEQVRGAVERMISRESAGINPDSKVDIQLKNVDDFLVSAIVSTYNSERFLCGCLEDLERQTIADRLEVIVVNSGSEENEEGIVKEFQRKYSNIVYIKTDEREGIYTAWNRGVRAASGKYITNANTDDRHRPDAYEVMVRTLEANPGAALVYGDQIVTDTANSDFESCHVVEEARRSEFSWERLLFGCCVGSGPMWRKSVHDELGFFDESLTCAGDWDFWLRIAKRYEFKHIGEVLGTYYNNEDGLEHGRKIHGWYERYIVGRRYGNPYISVMPVYKGNEKSLVSVIIPAYNAADYIGGAIESVLIQNYQNFELIIINDGSTDETQAIIDKFKDERIRCIRQENRGVSAACNEGIRQSMGRYIVRLDADDMMSPDFIAQHLQQFEKYPDADLVYCDDCLIDEKDKPIRVIKRPEYDDSGAMIRDLFAAGFPVVPFRTCIKRSVFDRIGFFDEGLVVAEDYDMMRKFVKAGLKCRHLASSLYLRRMTSDSLSRGWTKQKADAHFEVMRRYEESFDCTQLFCDVNWERIVPEQRGVYADYLCAIVYISIGKSYMENAPIYASVAFKRAETLLGSSLKNRPESEMIKKAMVKCDELKEQLPIVGANSEMSVVVSM